MYTTRGNLVNEEIETFESKPLDFFKKENGLIRLEPRRNCRGLFYALNPRQ